MAIVAPQPPRLPVPPSVESISCYRVVDRDRFASQAQAIGRVVFALAGTTGDGRASWLAGDNLSLGFADVNGLFESTPTRELPKSAEQAEQDCRKFLQRLEASLGKSGVIASLEATAFLPAELNLRDATPVYEPTRFEIDHWLCRFVPQIRATGSLEPAEAVECSVEVRVGAGGRALGLAVHWRPLAQQMLCSLIAQPDPRDLGWTSAAKQQAGTGTGEGDGANAARLVYAHAETPSGECWLLPYYVFDADPLERRHPAARHRLSGQTPAALMN
jgi:hypothetical protein